MNSVTRRDLSVLEAIISISTEQGYPPTVREIGTHLGLRSPSTVHGHLANLIAAGYIERAEGSPRAIKVLRTA